MAYKFLHLSDLHFSEQLYSRSCSIDQLKSIEKIYNSLSTENRFDRVIVTGDLTHDAKLDSFIRARSWLMKTMPLTEGNEIGLRIDDDKILKVVPGNRDFDFSKLYHQKFPDIFFEGLREYNSVFHGNHIFFQSRPIGYDWLDFPGESNSGLFLVYLNTSILGEGSDQLKLKKKFIDYTCGRIKTLVDQGLHGLLEAKYKSGKYISSDAFRKSFKIIISHHPLQSTSVNFKEYLDERTKRTFLSNLGIMDFQVQFSGHGHVYESPESTFYKIFDDRAKNRYVYNELKYLVGYNVDKVDILTSDDGRRLSNAFNMIFKILYSFVGDDEDVDRDIVSDISSILTKNKSQIVDLISSLIQSGRRVAREGDRELQDVQTFIDSLDQERREELERRSKDIFADIVKFIKNKSIVNFNAGSASIPYTSSENRHFNIYEIDKTDVDFSVVVKDYIWNEYSKEFELGSRTVGLYNIDKTKKK